MTAFTKAAALSADTLRELQATGEPVLVDFWATWCPPCRSLAPTIDALTTEFDGRVHVGKVDIDEESALAEEFSVSSVPTLVLFRGGVEVKRLVGARPLTELKSELDDLL